MSSCAEAAAVCPAPGPHLRLAIVSLDFHREGGSEGRTGHLVDRLVAQGHEVHLVGARIRGAWPPGAVAHRLPVPEHPHWLEVLLFSRRASRLVARERYDLAHSQLRPYVPGIVTAGGGCHRFYLDEVFPLEKPRLARLRARQPLHRVLLALEREHYRAGGCPCVIANSALGREGILRYYRLPPERVVVAHNGVDAERFSPALRARGRAELRAALGVPGDEMLLLFVGSGFARKGLGIVLAAMARLGADARARLAVVGAGSPRRWTRLADDLGLRGRVRFTGAVRDVERYYAAADLFVLPTLFDPFANTTLEAMASGLPVITSTRNGAAEVLTSGLDGIALPYPTEPAALAAAIAGLADPARRAAVGGRARETALKYTWDGPLEATLAVYRQVLRRPAADAGHAGA